MPADADAAPAPAPPAPAPAPAPAVTKAEWLVAQRELLEQALTGAGPGRTSASALLEGLLLLNMGYDIVFGLGWAAPLASACKGDLASHTDALRREIAAAPAPADGGEVSVEDLVAAQLAQHGSADGVRRAGSDNLVNHVLWISRILGFVSRFLQLVAREGEQKETYQAARLAYAEFLQPFHPTVLQWMVPPLLGLVPYKASMLALMGVPSDRAAATDADARRLALEAMQLLHERLHKFLGERSLLFTDKAGQAF